MLIESPGHILGKAWEGQSPQLTGPLRPSVRPSVRGACHLLPQELLLAEALTVRFAVLSVAAVV